MPEFERDFVLRQIRQLARVVARIVAKAREEEQYASGLEALRTAQEGLGGDFELLRRLDAASAALLVHDPEVLETLAWIAAQESVLLSGVNDEAGARDRRRRALALYAECAGRVPARAEACREAARARAEPGDLESLSGEQRRRLGIPPAAR